MQYKKNTISTQEKSNSKHNFSNLSIPLPQEEWNSYLQSFWENYQEVSSKKQEVMTLLAERVKVKPENFLISNTSLEILFLMYQNLQPKKIKIITPTVSFLELFTDKLKIKAVYSGFFSYQHKEDWVILTNPNPFSESVTYLDELEEILERNHKTSFIIDETWVDLNQQVSSASPLVKHYSNLWVLKSLTNIWEDVQAQTSILFSSSQNIRKLQKFYDPEAFQPFLWHILYFLLKEIQVPQEQLVKLKSELLRDISQISFLEVKNSIFHFFYLQKKNLSGQELQKKLLEKGIQVFFQEKKKGGGANFVRVTVSQKAEENTALLKALRTL